jgi:hypothetical protein
MMQIEMTEGISVPRWEQIVQNSPTSSFFHTPIWMKILKETYGYRAAPALFDMDGTKILVPMIEIRRFPFNFLESMPLGYGGFISPDMLSPAMLQSVIKMIVRGRHLKLYITLPPFTQTIPHDDFHLHKMQTEWDYTHVLPLDSNYERVAESFHRGPRRRIRMVEASDLTVRLTNDPKDYRSIYDLFTRRSAEWGYRKPPHPWALFKNLQHYGGQHVKLRITEMNGMPVGGAITFEYGTNAFHWMSLSPVDYMKYNSSDLLLQDLIQSLCERRFTHLDLGGSGKMDGVRRFKESYGAVKVPIYRYEACSLFGKILQHR